MIKNLSFDEIFSIILISCIFSHLAAWFFFNWVDHIWVIFIGWTLHTILWTPLVLYFIWIGTTRFQICQDALNFLFYWEYTNPFFDWLFKYIKKKTGWNPAPFYRTTEETLKLIEDCVYWMNEYDRLILKKLENETRMLERDYNNYLWMNKGHPRVVEYQKRLLSQKNFLIKTYAVYRELDTVFCEALDKKKNLRFAWIRYSAEFTDKRWKKYKLSFIAFNIRSLHADKPWYIVW